jgi:hypothetical protein
MDLVTVTCDLDFNQMLLQAESISKFLKPCTHWVVINDQHIDKEKWESALTPYYHNHTLKLVTPNWNSIPSDFGWAKQQAYKFVISKYVNDDYLLLDSKNFFIKPTDINEWTTIQGCGISEHLLAKGNKWIPTVQTYASKLNVNPSTTITCMQTPYVFKIEEIKKLGDIDLFAEWFLTQPITPSEFIFYSHLINYKNNNQPVYKHITLWPRSDEITKSKLNYITVNQDIKVFGLHRSYLKKLNFEQINIINSWLAELGLANKF